MRLKLLYCLEASADPNFDIYQLAANNRVNEDSVGARLDFKLNSSHSLYTRFFP